MHRSLNQGKFFVNKKRSHQYLENNKKTLLREGFIEGVDVMGNNEKEPSDDWYEFEKNQIDFGLNTPLESREPNIKKIDGWVLPSSAEWTDDLSTMINKVCEDIEKLQSNNNIYAFLINNSTGDITYYKVDVNGDIPQNPIPKLKAKNEYTTYLKIDNGMIEATRKLLEVDDPINKSVKTQREKYQKLQTLYDKALKYYTDETNSYYQQKGEAQASMANKAFKNNVIKWQDGPTTKLSFINKLGVRRDFAIPNSELPTTANNSLQKAFTDSNFRKEIGCPTPHPDILTKAQVEGENYTMGGVITTAKGACVNPGVYQSDDGASGGKIWIDELGVPYSLGALSSSCKKAHVNTLKSSIYSSISKEDDSNANLGSKSADFKCLLGVQGAQDTMQTHKENATAANDDLKVIANCASSESETNPQPCSLTLGQDVYGSDAPTSIDQGMKQVIGSIQSSVGDGGYRKLHHALMNDDTVYLPMEDDSNPGKAMPHFKDGVRISDSYKDISGNLSLQRRLNDKLRLVDDLGTSVDSLDASLLLRNRQIKAVNLQFLAWGLAGITFAFIAVKQFSKK